MGHKDIMLDPDEEKEKIYEGIHELYLQGKTVKIRERKSGFPAVDVDCEDIHIITDIISLEQWWQKNEAKRKQQLNTQKQMK